MPRLSAVTLHQTEQQAPCFDGRGEDGVTDVGGDEVAFEDVFKQVDRLDGGAVCDNEMIVEPALGSQRVPFRDVELSGQRGSLQL